MRQLLLAGALLLAACGNDGEPQAEGDAAPSSDAQTGEDGGTLHDAGADTWTEPDAGHPLYRTCTPGNTGECPDITLDGGIVFRALDATDAGGVYAGGCAGDHRIVKDRDIYGTCVYACDYPGTPAVWQACRWQLGGECLYWPPTTVPPSHPGAIGCIPGAD